MCCVCGVVSLEFMVVLYGFNLWSVPVFFFWGGGGLVVVFNFSVSLFLLLLIDLICSQVCIVTSLVFLWYLVTENSSF